MPLEFNGAISFQEQISISAQGVKIILDLLNKRNIKATFFSTAIFAQNNVDLIKRIVAEGHEIASHTYHHSSFEEKDLAASKKEIENIAGVRVYGLRMPRMMGVSKKSVKDAGYIYDSSINPTWIPGRYNNRHISRTKFWDNDIVEIPASVSPTLRVPLFWLSFHNFPLSVYQHFFKLALKKDGYANIYFHPWEFMNISNPEYKLPFYTTKNTGQKMVKRFEQFLDWGLKKSNKFGTLHQLLAVHPLPKQP